MDEPRQSPLNRFEQEFNAYMAEPNQFEFVDFHSFNPLEYWRANSSVYPHLSQVVKQWILLPITSASSESLFSVSAFTTAFQPCSCDFAEFNVCE